jgi:hypothetical protein
MHLLPVSRRIFGLLAFAFALVVTTVVQVQSQTAPAVTRPVIAEQVSPVEQISPVARDGYAGTAFVRRPPGAGPFPAVVIIHPGLTAWSMDALRALANGTQASRFLAAGYVVAATTYRSRDADPQTTVSLQDSLATVDYLPKRQFVDAKSIVIWDAVATGTSHWKWQPRLTWQQSLPKSQPASCSPESSTRISETGSGAHPCRLGADL